MQFWRHVKVARMGRTINMHTAKHISRLMYKHSLCAQYLQANGGE